MKLDNGLDRSFMYKRGSSNQHRKTKQNTKMQTKWNMVFLHGNTFDRNIVSLTMYVKVRYTLRLILFIRILRNESK